MKNDPAPPRRRATQARSKATVDKILASATRLVSERGGAVTMSEIARDTGLVLATLYQYFADRSAILQALLIRHYEEVNAMLADALDGSATLDALLANMEATYAAYFDLHQSDPLYRSIWSIIQTDADLQALDLADTLNNAALMHRAALPLYRDVDSDELMATCALALQTASTASRFAIAIPEPLPRLSKAVYVRMMRAAFTGLERD